MSDATTPNVIYHVQPGGALRGRRRVPGDKSISHRAIMLGALAEGVTEISGFLAGEDNLSTLKAFQAMGVSIEGPHAGCVRVQGVGLLGLKPPAGPLDLGNSGTSMRLLCGLLAGQRFDTLLTGDASLSRRPMRRVTDPLSKMGAHLTPTAAGTPPLAIRGNASLHGIDYILPIASAQIKSALLLAGLYAQGRTCITEPAPSRDHTERMLQGFGYPVERVGATVCVHGGGTLTAAPIEVPADISSAAFFLVGAAISPGSDLVLEHVGVNPTRTGILTLLRQMGAEIQIFNQRIIGGEPVADLAVRYAPLKGILIPPEVVPLAIDEFPALFIAAACATGETVLTGAHELRVKESDRIQVMADGLLALGVDARPTPDGIVIRGSALNGKIGKPGAQPVIINSRGDHRIAMSFAMAALRAHVPLEIHDCANVNTSFPGFVALAHETGLNIGTANV